MTCHRARRLSAWAREVLIRASCKMMTRADTRINVCRSVAPSFLHLFGLGPRSRMDFHMLLIDVHENNKKGDLGPRMATCVLSSPLRHSRYARGLPRGLRSLNRRRDERCVGVRGMGGRRVDFL